jgi:asparagine synthase (glutamine-hydrolysing)
MLAERVPGAAGRAADLLLSALPAPPGDRHSLARARRFFRSMHLPFDERLAQWTSIFSGDLAALVRPEILQAAAPFDPLRHLRPEMAAMEGRTLLSRALHANFVSYLADDLLVKTDRCTMANALEARSPFLDRELTEYVAALPDDFKLRGRETKSILREAFADLLPAPIQARGKMGFGVPLGAWFRGELRGYVRDLLLAPQARYREYLDPAYVERLVTSQIEGTAHVAHQLWTVMCFERWLQLLPDWQRGSVLAKHPDVADLHTH